MSFVAPGRVPFVLLVLATLLLVAGRAPAGEIRLDRGAVVEDLLARMSPSHSAPGERVATLVNPLDEPTVWRLSTETVRPHAFRIAIDDEAGASRTVLQSRHPYALQLSRASQGRRLASAPIVLGPGERVRLHARALERGADPGHPIRLEPEAAFTAREARLSLVHGAYFGAGALFIAFFATFALLLGSRPAVYYALYFAALLALNLHAYGYLETLLFHAFPQAYFPAFRPLQIAVIVSYLAFARSFLRTRERRPRLHRFVGGYIAATAALALLEAAFWSPAFVLVVDAVALGFLLLGTGAAVLAVRERYSGAAFFAAGWALLFATGVMNYVASAPRFARFNDAADAATLVLQLADAVVFAAAIIAQTRALRADRDAAVTAELSASREALALARSLLESRSDRDAAVALAERTRASMAATTHDLRQPLVSLQSALARLDEAAPEAAGQVRAGIDYLRSVLQGAGEGPAAVSPERAPAPSSRPAVSLAAVFANVETMFADEAARRGVRLRTVHGGLVVDAAPIALMRIVSNLVANAVKYAPGAAVVVAARRRAGSVRIEVRDSGPGLDAATLERVLRPYERGADDPDGTGLGLAIVRALGEENGWTFRAESAPGLGSIFAIEGIEAAARPAALPERDGGRPTPGRLDAPPAGP